MTYETARTTLERNLRMCKAVCDDLSIPYQNVAKITPNSKALTRLGMCTRKDAHNFEIEISTRLLEDGIGQKMLMNTMLHELLHTCEGCFNHGKRWKCYAARLNAIGYDVQTYITEEEERLTKKDSDYRYKVTCEGCGAEWKYMRRGDTVRALQRDPHSCTCGCGCKNFRLDILS